MLAASAISIGWKRKSNCGTPKSNSAWKVERPIRKPPPSAARRSISQNGTLPVAILAAGGCPGVRVPSASSTPWPTSDTDGAADQHQVRRAPQRHVLAEEPVPDVVEREADQREAAAAAISMPPSGAYQPS